MSLVLSVWLQCKETQHEPGDTNPETPHDICPSFASLDSSQVKRLTQAVPKGNPSAGHDCSVPMGLAIRMYVPARATRLCICKSLPGPQGYVMVGPCLGHKAVLW